MPRTLRLYIDYKSPYAYLAKDLAYDLERDTGVAIDWLPYTLDIPAYLGSARVDGRNTVLEESRNAHQWRRVKYSYMDCRREANLRGLVIRGTQPRPSDMAGGRGHDLAVREGARRRVVVGPHPVDPRGARRHVGDRLDGGLVGKAHLAAGHRGLLRLPLFHGALLGDGLDPAEGDGAARGLHGPGHEIQTPLLRGGAGPGQDGNGQHADKQVGESLHRAPPIKER